MLSKFLAKVEIGTFFSKIWWVLVLKAKVHSRATRTWTMEPTQTTVSSTRWGHRKTTSMLLPTTGVASTRRGFSSSGTKTLRAHTPLETRGAANSRQTLQPKVVTQTIISRWASLRGVTQAWVKKTILSTTPTTSRPCLCRHRIRIGMKTCSAPCSPL